MNTQEKSGLDEEVRLARLHGTGMLDTPEEAAFDEITQLAAAICAAPIALVSLVDRDRQWFKSHTGTDLRETPREQSVCAYTMLGDSLLVIPDTRTDPRTRANPMVCDASVAMQFYAGAPLITSDGTRLGALCVLDHTPRDLTALQRQALGTLAQQVVTQIELRRALALSESATTRLKEALDQQDILAKEIDHRVRNSLQQVGAFLRLQAQRAGDDTVKAALVQAQGRVAAIAEVHAALNRAGSAQTVALQPYFDRLADSLDATLPEGVTLSVDVDDLRLPSKTASAVAVIANEFIANSLKYAFPDGRTGRIEITVRRNGDALEGSFRDDGIGHDGATGGDGGGLGLQIIEASAAQIGGSVTFGSGPGTTLDLNAPL